MRRVLLLLGVLVGLATLTACSSSKHASAQRIAKCTERMVSRIDFARNPTLTKSAARQYVRRTYCEPFAQRGWVYPDGTFKLAAYTRSTSSSCSMGEAGQPSHRVPCKSLENQGSTAILDCGFLRFVRKSDAQRYIASLTHPSIVKCDNGMRLADVGAS
jgi:hypothetical protein